MAPKFSFKPEYSSGRRRDLEPYVTMPEEADKDLRESSSEIIPNFDPSIPAIVPIYKTHWTASWKVKIKKSVQEISLNDVSFIREALSHLMRSRKMFDTEVHLMWFSYIPQNLFQENMSVSLHFTETTDESRALMATNTAPAHLYIHHIFYPGHAVELWGSPIPWKITLDLSRIPVSERYTCGELHIKVTGKQGPVPRMEAENQAQMIAIVPYEQAISGITLTRPRIPSSEMIRGYVKRGVHSQAKVDKLIKLQSIGVDVEGMSLTGKLDHVLKALPDRLLETRGDEKTKAEIGNKIIQALGKPKKRGGLL